MIDKEILEQYGFKSEEQLEKLPDYMKKISETEVAVLTPIGIFELKEIPGHKLERILNQSVDQKNKAKLLTALAAASITKLNNKEQKIGELTIAEYGSKTYTKLTTGAQYINGQIDFSVNE